MGAVELELEGHGGDALRAALSVPEPAGDEARPGVVWLAPPDPPGDSGLVDALVAGGFAVLAPDLLTRERGVGGELPAAPPDRRALADVDAALARLAAEPGVDPEHLAVVGRGAGGTLAFLSGCHSDRPLAVVSLGGRIVRDALSATHPLQPLEMALNLGCPFLGVFAEGDAALPAGELEHARAVLSQFARSFDIVSLPGADPGFHEGEGADRVVDFLRGCVD